MVALIIT